MGSSTTTSSGKPWGPVQPLLKDVFKDATQSYENGPYYYQGSTVTPFSNQTTDAFKGMMNVAGNNSDGNGSSDNMQRILNNGGFTNGQMNTLGNMSQLANNRGLDSLANGNGFTGGQNNTMQDINHSTNQATNMLDRLMQNGGYNSAQSGALSDAQHQMNRNPFDNLLEGNGLTQTQKNAYGDLAGGINQSNRILGNIADNRGQTTGVRQALGSSLDALQGNDFQNMMDGSGLNNYQQAAINKNRQTMNSNFDINSDPNYQQVRQNTLGAQAQALNGQAAAAGRYAGGANQSILAREQGKTAAQMDSNQYDKWHNDVQNATNNVFQQGQQGTANKFGATSALGQLQNQAANLGQTALGNETNALSQINANNANMFGVSGTGLSNQLQANSALSGLQNNVFNMGQQGVTNRSNAANQTNQLQNSQLNAQEMGVNNRSNAINQLSGLDSNLFNSQNAGLNNVSTAYQNLLQPYQTEQGVGAQYEDLYNRNMQDNLRKFDAQNPLNQFSQYLQVANGQPITTQQTSTPSTLQTALSGGIGGLGLLGSLFG